MESNRANSDTGGNVGNVTQSFWRNTEDSLWILDIERRSCDTEVILETPKILRYFNCVIPAQENCFQGIKLLKEKESCYIEQSRKMLEI